MTEAFEVELAVAPWRKKWLRLDAQTITFGDASIEVAEIDAVRVEERQVRYCGLPVAIQYRIWLESESGAGLTLNWWRSALARGRRRRLSEQLYLRVLEFLDDQVGPRVVARAVNQPWPVQLASVEFTRDGLSVDTIIGRRNASWPRVVGVRLHEDRHQIVTEDRRGNQELLGSVQLVEPNSIFLPDVVAALQTRAAHENGDG